MGVGIAQSTSNSSQTAARNVSIASSSSIQPCPDCSTPHEADSGNFCEICGYNFLTGAKGGDPLSNFPPPIKSATNLAATAPTQPPNHFPDAAIAHVTTVKCWQVTISIDPTLATPDSPTAPTQSSIIIPLDHPTNLIGRTSQARAIHPEIPLDLDDAVSSRHAILTLHPDGKLVLQIGRAHV